MDGPGQEARREVVHDFDNQRERRDDPMPKTDQKLGKASANHRMMRLGGAGDAGRQGDAK